MPRQSSSPKASQLHHPRHLTLPKHEEPELYKERARLFSLTINRVFCQSLFRNADLSSETHLGKVPGKKKNKKNLSTKPAKLTSIGLEKHPLMETFSQPRASAALPPPSRSEEELHCLGADRLLLGK